MGSLGGVADSIKIFEQVSVPVSKHTVSIQKLEEQFIDVPIVADEKDHVPFQLSVGLPQTKPVGELLRLRENIPKLFEPIKVRGQEFQNRIQVSPMCMYSCNNQDGVFTLFHLGHYGNLALRGPSLVIIEATAIEPNGRISLQDVGIWNDEQAEALTKLTRLTRAAGTSIGIQLCHSGRKGGIYPPYYNQPGNAGRIPVPRTAGGFSEELISSSAIPWKNKGFCSPKELTKEEIKGIVQKFADAAERCVSAGIDVIEIHAGHGYLIHQFLSGNTNNRTDEYGGSMENRFRFFLEILTAIRAVIPKDMPLYARMSGTDYANGTGILDKDPNGWDIQQVIELCRRAVPLGLDVVDISSGGNLSSVTKGISGCTDFGFQIPLAEEIKKAGIRGLLVAAVGGMHNAKLADKVLRDGKADIILIGRQFIKDPSLVYTFAEELGVKVRWPIQYSWMWPT